MSIESKTVLQSSNSAKSGRPRWPPGRVWVSDGRIPGSTLDTIAVNLSLGNAQSAMNKTVNVSERKNCRRRCPPHLSIVRNYEVHLEIELVLLV
ncbi:hypothetical protein AVEN_184911-1 [Araneus ventricosus]|uniref:Uncharacterized protein n=1 Tax=Araneus ventricosus TaxID=182803 RepID=A0A4Y2K4Z7_ARAVE|nr:hypothetical protein AVEN_184911-1 [Araneus ventricosus]